MLRITEIFASIQGESSHAGLPFVFVRLTGCNLRCRYCDTAYAYEGGDEASIEEILVQVAAFAVPRVAVTGGEPLLQPEAFGLVRALLDHGYAVLVETNGAVPLASLDPRAVKIMDVKCPSSGEAGKMIWENFEALTPQDEVKFVIADAEDYAYAKDVIARYRPGREFQPLLSPAFGLMPPDRLAGWIVSDALDARFQIQLHKVVWDPARRGV
ncbi:MAG TPA: radical SAM protein [Candidatus Deferrimicrobiaceae bacterium]|jgi:7-carboxy-7-deazaguanine synthase